MRNLTVKGLDYSARGFDFVDLLPEIDVLWTEVNDGVSS
jgi:hypothetical protein